MILIQPQPSNASRGWVSRNGEVFPQTPSQHALVATPFFQMTLRLYRDAVEKGRQTVDSRLAHLHQQMQSAYEKECPSRELRMSL